MFYLKMISPRQVAITYPDMATAGPKKNLFDALLKRALKRQKINNTNLLDFLRMLHKDKDAFAESPPRDRRAPSSFAA